MSGALRILTSGELELFVDIPLGTSDATVLALAIRVPIGVLFCPHHKPTSVNKELLGRPEGIDGFRS